MPGTVTVKIITDIHGEYGALAAELSRDDTAVLLGDYLNMIDFQTLDGILTQVFPRQLVSAVLSVMASNESEIMHRAVRDSVKMPSSVQEKLTSLMREGYLEFFRAIPCRCFMVFGNTDDPALIDELKQDNTEVLKTGTVEIEGEVFGFISGVPAGKRSVGLPGEIPEEEYNDMVDSLGPVDVLCTHFPPAIPEMTWDVVADRDEYGSRKLLSYIEKNKPRIHYFGHVHNPHVRDMTHGTTRLINAGFFRAHKKALEHRPSEMDVIQ